MNIFSSLLRITPVAAAFFLAGCLDDSTTIIEDHMDPRITIEIATDVDAPAEVTYPVSVSEWVRIDDFEIQITHLSIHTGDTGDEDVDNDHKTVLLPLHGDEPAADGQADTGDDDHSDSTNDPTYLEDALPIVIGLEDGDLTLGTWLIEADEAGMIDLELGSTATTPAVRIEGVFVSAATTVTTETPLEIELDASIEVALETGMPMMVESGTRLQVLLSITDLFEGLTFPAPATDGDIHITDAVTGVGADIIHRLSEGITAGLDVDGDNHVDADEHHFSMPAHDE